MERLSYILAILGLFFIVLGISYIVFEGVHKDICNNTRDIKWYYENCMEEK